MTNKKSIFIAISVYVVAFLLFSLGARGEEKSTAPATSPLPVVAKPKRINKMIAVLDTSMGEIRAKLYFDRVQKTVNNFVGLAEGTITWVDAKTKKKMTNAPYYKDVLFHRVINGFMIQTGDQTGTGSGGTGNKPFATETYSDLPHKKGVLAMANRGPGTETNDAQFYITLAPQPRLDGGYTVFGEVISGMEVVEKIGAVKTSSDDRPTSPVTLKSVKIIRE
jgi:peptidyl-prolyl cis-trans isomerase A (cyclophilin A)